MRNRLSVLQRLRAIEERRAQADAARAQRDARRAEARVGDARHHYETRPAADEMLGPVQLRALQLMGTGALEVLQEAVVARDDADEVRRGAQDALSLAAVRRKSVERLAERRMVEAARVAQAAADRALDELMILRRARA